MQLDKVSPWLLLKMKIKLAWEIEQDTAAKFELPIAFHDLVESSQISPTTLFPLLFSSMYC
jgi:hypothetical protein